MPFFSICFLFFIVLFFLSCFIDPAISDPRATQAALVCTNRTASVPDRSTFVANFLASMDSVTPLIASQRFARVVNGTGNNTVYAFGECMKDLSQRDCNQCFAQCKTMILRCFPFQRGVRGGRNYFDGCYLRYDDYDFSDEALSPGDRTVCGQAGLGNNSRGFRENSIELLRNLSLQAPDNDGFSVGSVDRWGTPVYGLAQCWEGLNRSSCVRCLANASMAVRSCLPMSEGRALNAGCYLRYSPQRFYYNSTGDDAGSRRGRRHLVIILAVVSSVVALSMSIAACAFFGRRKLANRREERKRLGGLLATVKKSDRNFKYETLEKATNYFNNSNKLGQGGSGSVYKGILPDGRAVAVKRLFFTTRQWVDQFFNEVNLISEVHHKNLVKLLGCSITGPESLLVYEYVPNRSVQDYLFDKNSTHLLNWDVRFNIILGTAEGLAYLHEESKLRIIHRDIKLSNILLDENFLPKIADFGLVRLFPEDKSHISTAIAGTLGYMAPEYVTSGKLTEKADVYSFGVLLIEVICGKRNNSFIQDSISMLQMVWNYYTSGRLLDLVDPALEGSFQDDKAYQVLQVGLLCTQASAELRPAMSTVVSILTGNSEIPLPITQPPFLNSYNRRSSPILAGINDSQPESHTQSSGNTITQSDIEPR